MSMRFATRLFLADAAYWAVALGLVALSLAASVRLRRKGVAGDLAEAISAAPSGAALKTQADLLSRLLPAARAAGWLVFLSVVFGLLAPGSPAFGVIRYWAFTALLALPLLGAGHALLLDDHPRLRAAVGAAALMAAGAGAWAWLVEPRRLVTEVVRVPSRVPLVRPLRLVLVADLQTDRVGAHERRALEVASALKPDLLLLAGDYLQVPDVESFAAQRALLAPLLAEAAQSARLGAFAVGGNSDHRRLLPSLFEGTGIVLLVDRSVAVEGAGVPLRLTGLSVNRGFRSDEAQLGHLLPPAPEGGLHLVLSHAPDFVVTAAALGTADLVVAGHTHGGQVVVPGFGPPITFSRLPRETASGLHTVGGLPLVVSRGVGMERLNAPRIRLFCPPDVTLVLWGGPPS